MPLCRPRLASRAMSCCMSIRGIPLTRSSMFLKTPCYKYPSSFENRGLTKPSCLTPAKRTTARLIRFDEWCTRNKTVSVMGPNSKEISSIVSKTVRPTGNLPTCYSLGCFLFAHPSSHSSLAQSPSRMLGRCFCLWPAALCSQ